MRRDGEMVDALDSDSSVCKNIWVQVPFSTPEQKIQPEDLVKLKLVLLGKES